jgi:hypothetical protein
MDTCRTILWTGSLAASVVGTGKTAGVGEGRWRWEGAKFKVKELKVKE